MTHPTESLSAYLDGDLPSADLATVEAHLAQCPECTRLVTQLRAVAAWAPNYQGLPTSRDLWPGIASRVSSPGSAVVGRVMPRPWWDRSIAVSLPTLAAAGIVLLLLVGGVIWIASSGVRGGDGRDSTFVIQTSATLVPAATESVYDQAIAQLEQVLAEGEGVLDSTTVTAVHRSLRQIDRAIADARAAIVRDSSNAFLDARIVEHMKRKLEILRTVAQAVSAQS